MASRNFRVGERVMVHHHVPCGQCYYCRKQTFAQCAVYKKVGATAGFEPSGGGFAEYIRVMNWIVSATAWCAFQTAFPLSRRPSSSR